MGLTIVTQGNGGSETLMVVLYYYDAGQQPRWALGSASQVDFGSEITVDMLRFSGFCLNYAPGGVEPTPAGTVRLRLVAPSLGLDAGNIADVDVEFSGAPGGSRRTRRYGCFPTPRNRIAQSRPRSVPAQAVGGRDRRRKGEHDDR